MMNLFVPVAEISTKPSPCEAEKFEIGFSILKGVVTRYTELDYVTLVCPDDSATDVHREAQVYDVKHMVLSDLSKYTNLMKYYADGKCSRFMSIRKQLRDIYKGLVDGELVTLVFFTIHPDASGELSG
ncbi:MAG: hypothetical protein JRC86_00850 [Deltaproteobacteria bacterium]|nr:hypothetical protein [Deltaproteobacteria bacterium]